MCTWSVYRVCVMTSKCDIAYHFVFVIQFLDGVWLLLGVREGVSPLWHARTYPV